MEQLRLAGKSLYELIERMKEENTGVSYLLVLEGNTAWWQNPETGRWNYESIPDKGYTLSYCRALSLYNYWAEVGFDFQKMDNCELMIAGSGYFGKSRESDESKNKRFTIQITGKIGEFK